jgi:ABC-type transporter Mla subunit MlaD
VGTVRRLSVEGRRAKITFSLVPEAQVREDAIATIRAKSLLGEKYLDILPQSDSAPLLKTGGQLTTVIETTDIDQLITKMKPVLDTFLGTPQKPGMLADAAELTRMLRESVAEARATMPETLRNVRDLTADLKKMTDENGTKLGEMLDSMDKLAKASEKVVAQNSQKLSDTMDSTKQLAQTSAQLLAQHEKQIARTVENTDKITSVIAQNADEIARNLRTISANVAAASEKFPELAEAMSRLSAKLDVTLEVSNRLLQKADSINMYTIRKLLQEEGITANLFPRKVKPEPEEQKGKEEKAKGK